jgi:hypothetical protein
MCGIQRIDYTASCFLCGEYTTETETVLECQYDEDGVFLNTIVDHAPDEWVCPLGISEERDHMEDQRGRGDFNSAYSCKYCQEILYVWSAASHPESACQGNRAEGFYFLWQGRTGDVPYRQGPAGVHQQFRNNLMLYWDNLPSMRDMIMANFERLAALAAELCARRGLHGCF